jgi:hypothetical protein
MANLGVEQISNLQRYLFDERSTMSVLNYNEVSFFNEDHLGVSYSPGDSEAIAPALFLV